MVFILGVKAFVFFGCCWCSFSGVLKRYMNKRLQQCSCKWTICEVYVTMTIVRPQCCCGHKLLCASVPDMLVNYGNFLPHWSFSSKCVFHRIEPMENNSCNTSLCLLCNCHKLNSATTLDPPLGKPMRHTAGACACDMAVKSGPFSDVPDLHWTCRVATCLHNAIIWLICLHWRYPEPLVSPLK